MAHWYAQDGSTKYEVENKSTGGLRPTTLGDAKKLGLVPSVTTVLSCVAKPGLDKWKGEQIIAATLMSNSQRHKEEDKAYIGRILAAAGAVSKEAAEKGNEIHNYLENYYKTGLLNEGVEYVQPALEIIKNLTSLERTDFIAEASFSTPQGFGGKVDLHTKLGNGIIIDYKTKSKDILDKGVLYEDYCVQLAAYRIGLGLPQAQCINVFLSTTKPGTIFTHTWPEEDLQRGEKMFLCLLAYWKLANKYESHYEQQS